MIRKFAMVGVAAVAALMLMSTVALSTAFAQAALPYKAYGSGLKAAQAVEAFKGTASVGKATVDASGNWSIDIQAGGAANVANGDKITFNLDGKAATQSVTFQGGQFPAPPGLALTVAAGGTTNPPAPAPAKTGNAGLFGTTGTSMALVLVLGVFAVTMVAGARTATRR
ncbi:MAG: hypothetical protein O2822_04055 [Chloroflexi bacterium]|nr:hypothetical protein [Chloroflexota bacterium]